MRRRGLLTALALAAGLGLASLLHSADTLPFFCLFRRVTSLPCPSCGLTHAFVAMGHGQWLEAWRANIAGPLLYGACWVSVGLGLAQGLLGRDLLAAAWNRFRPMAVPVIFSLAGLAWAVGLVRRFCG